MKKLTIVVLFHLSQIAQIATGSGIYGKVVDQFGAPLQNVKVYITNSDLVAFTKSNGKFTLPFISGNTTIQITLPSPEYLEVPESSWNGYQTRERYPNGRDIGQLVIFDQTKMIMRLKVTDQNGNPLSGVWVTNSNSDQPLPDLVSDSDGFCITNWKADQWRFKAVPPNERFMTFSKSALVKSVRAEQCARGCFIGEISLFKIDSNWELNNEKYGSGILETVKDRKTGLIWTRKYYTGLVSKNLAELRTMSGNPDWRLPTFAELKTLYNNLPLRPDSQLSRAEGLNRTSPPFYWADKSYANNRNYLSADRVPAPEGKRWLLRDGYRTLNFIFYQHEYIPKNDKGFHRFVRTESSAANRAVQLSDNVKNTIQVQNVLKGQASKRESSWPFKLTITNFSEVTGEWSGEIEWLTLKAIHRVEGTVRDNQIVFTETRHITRGNASLGCIYTLYFIEAKKQFVGNWEECQTRMGPGEVWIDIVESNNNKSNSESREIIPGQFPKASMHLLTEQDLEILGKAELRLMRNEIFARHGYIFKSSDLKDHFENQVWYKPLYSDVTSKLTPVELKNISFIKAYELRH